MWKKKPDERRFEGRRGPRGPAGPAGPSGARGPEGPRGKTGAQGKSAPLDTLEALTAHVEQIGHDLGIQLQRIAQLQQQLDEARAAIKRMSTASSNA